MALEWIQSVATAVVGVAGIGGTLWATRRQTQTQVALAREERQQRRLEEAYMELSKLLNDNYDWVLALLGHSGPDAAPTPAPPAPAYRLASRAYWSPEVVRLVQEFERSRDQLLKEGISTRVWDAVLKRRAEESGEAVEPHDRPSLKAAADEHGLREQAIREQVRRELLGLDGGSRS